VSGTRFAQADFPWSNLFPLSLSAAGCPTLFEDFTGTTGLSDFPRSFIIGVRLRLSMRPKHLPLWRTRISRFPCECFGTCAGSVTTRTRMPLAISAHTMLPSATPYGVGVPEEEIFAAEYRPAPSLSTLQSRPHEQLRMTRSQCGSLNLHCMKLSFTTPRRFTGAQGEFHVPQPGKMSVYKLFNWRDSAADTIQQTVQAFLELGEAVATRWIQTRKGVMLLQMVPDTTHPARSTSSIGSATTGTCSRSRVRRPVHL